MWKFKRQKPAPEPRDEEPVVGVDAPEFTEEEVKALRQRFRFDEVRGRFEKRDGAA